VHKQEITFCCIAPKMLTSCPCDGGLSKNIISQSDHSTRAKCNVARLAKNDWDTSQKFGIWGFCQNFLQKYCDSLIRDSIFWWGSKNGFGWLSPNLVSSVFFGWPESPNLVIRVTQITK
jgi:hypothetical protein